MGPCLMIIVHILPRDFLKVALVESQDMVQALTTQGAEKAFALGAPMGVRISLIPVPAAMEEK